MLWVFSMTVWSRNGVVAQAWVLRAQSQGHLEQGHHYPGAVWIHVSLSCNGTFCVSVDFAASLINFSTIPALVVLRDLMNGIRCVANCLKMTSNNNEPRWWTKMCPIKISITFTPYWSSPQWIVLAAGRFMEFPLSETAKKPSKSGNTIISSIPGCTSVGNLRATLRFPCSMTHISCSMTRLRKHFQSYVCSVLMGFPEKAITT